MMVHNGEFTQDLNITAENRAFNYGDALFESMLFFEKRCLLWPYHLQRLQEGAQSLSFNLPTVATLQNDLNKALNSIDTTAKAIRVRMTVYRADGGLYAPTNNHSGYVISCTPKPQITSLFPIGECARLGLYQENHKATGPLSGFKSASALLYVMAALFAQKQQYQDVVLLNERGNCCECTASNLFLVKNESLFTPSLSEGCVMGTMRRYILDRCQAIEIPVHEKPVSINDLLDADEVFTTNAVSGMKVVNQFRERQYERSFTHFLHNQLF